MMRSNKKVAISCKVMAFRLAFIASSVAMLEVGCGVIMLYCTRNNHKLQPREFDNPSLALLSSTMSTFFGL